MFLLLIKVTVSRWQVISLSLIAKKCAGDEVVNVDDWQPVATISRHRGLPTTIFLYSPILISSKNIPRENKVKLLFS